MLATLLCTGGDVLLLAIKLKPTTFVPLAIVYVDCMHFSEFSKKFVGLCIQ